MACCSMALWLDYQKYNLNVKNRWIFSQTRVDLEVTLWLAFGLLFIQLHGLEISSLMIGLGLLSYRELTNHRLSVDYFSMAKIH